MKFRFSRWIFAVFFFAVFPALPVFAICAKAGVEREISERSWVWTWTGEEGWRGQGAPPDEESRRLRERLRMRRDLRDPRDRIRHYLEVVSATRAHGADATDALRFNLERVLSGDVGRLRAVDCLESLLMTEAHRRRSLLDEPYEWGAVILSRPGSGPGGTEHRIYLTLGKQRSVSFGEIVPLLERDLAARWALKAQIHNHPFVDPDPRGASGFTAPGPADVETARRWLIRYGLESSRITNGIFTFEMRPADFQLLQGSSGN